MRFYRALIMSSLTVVGGFVTGVGTALALGMPWRSVPPYMFNVVGILMIVSGLVVVQTMVIRWQESAKR